MTSDERIVEAAELYRRFMLLVGIPIDDNSKDTPLRYARMMYYERCISLRLEPPELTSFPEGSYDEYVAIKDIPFFSMCSHHHVTFYGKVHICYFPNKRVVGLSKLARVVNFFAGKPQIQEQLTAEIAEYLFKCLDPIGIIVKVVARHLCMEARGVKAVGSLTVTQKIIGHIDKEEAENLFRG